jgi:hypothetical protein
MYLGKPGALVALPSPLRGAAGPFERRGSARDTIGGGRVVDFAPGGTRTYTLQWRAFPLDSYAVVEAFYLGHNGGGPFVLLDVGRRNLLTANQSAATSVLDDTTGFAAAGAGEAIASSATLVERGPKALAWSMPNPLITGLLRLTTPNPAWLGFPVVAGLTYRWQYRARGAGTDPIVEHTPKLKWMDAAGATLSTSSGSAASTSSGAWSTLFVQAAAPAGAVYAEPQVQATIASVSGTSTQYLDKLSLAIPTSYDDGTIWRPGSGVPLVSLLAMPESYQWIHTRECGLTVIEVS